MSRRPSIAWWAGGLGLAGVVVLAGLVALLLRIEGQPDPEPPPATASEARAAVPASPGEPLATSAPLPPSLAGTREDGALVLDARGHFVPTPDAIDLFDYYLSALGEEPATLVHARVLAAIDAHLLGEAAEAARALFGDYLRYRERAGALLSGPLLGEDLERRIQYVRELRREIFGAGVAEALFGEQEARWFADLARRRVALDDRLTPEEKRERLDALYAELPDEVRASVETASAHDRLRQAEAALLAEGAGAAEIRQLRAERFGEEAAERLAALDAERARWQDRLERYREEREQLEREVPAAERSAAIQALLDRHFDEREQIRARALDAAASR